MPVIEALAQRWRGTADDCLRRDDRSGWFILRRQRFSRLVRSVCVHAADAPVGAVERFIERGHEEQTLRAASVEGAVVLEIEQRSPAELSACGDRRQARAAVGIHGATTCERERTPEDRCAAAEWQHPGEGRIAHVVEHALRLASTMPGPSSAGANEIRGFRRADGARRANLSPVHERVSHLGESGVIGSLRIRMSGIEDGLPTSGELTMTEPHRRRRPSFVDGVAALFAGVGFILRQPRAWPAAAVPALVASVLSAALIWLSFDWVGPVLSEYAVPRSDSGLASFARSAVRWLGSLLAAYLSVLVAIALTPALSAPALERLVRLQEDALGAAPRPAQGFWFELRCELEAQLLSLALLTPFALLVWGLGLLVPPLLPLLAPLQAVLVSLSVAWNLLSYPLTLSGVRARARLALMADNAAAVLGFGAAFAAAALVPGLALLLLPAGVVGATRLVGRTRGRAGFLPV
jgi:CysZ protein